MDIRIKIIWLITVMFCILLICSSCLYKERANEPDKSTPAKFVESFPDHSRIPDNNLK